MEAVKGILKILWKLFIIRTDVYGTRTARDERIWQVKKPLTDAVLFEHLLGEKPVGAYSTTPDGRVKWMCSDLDVDNFADVRKLKMHCKYYNLPVYVERSKRRGFHVWGFFRSQVPAYRVRTVFNRILAETGMEATELFPKQNCLRKGGYGNFVWLPLYGYLRENGLARRGRTVFVDDDNSPYLDQFKFLSNVEFISEEELNKVIEVNGLKSGEMAVEGDGLTQQRDSEVRMPDERKRENNYFLAPPCLRRILREGVSEGIRNEACFRLSVFLYRADIPVNLGLVVLEHWNLKNQPPLAGEELEIAVRQGYSGHYRSYGCQNLKAYCSADCPIYEYRRKRGWL